MCHILRTTVIRTAEQSSTELAACSHSLVAGIGSLLSDIDLLDGSAVQELLTTAVAMHSAGNLAPAARLYQQILAQEPDHADALHLLGVLRHQMGEQTLAVDLIGRAIVLRPNVPAFHANLAEAYRALGDHERAIGCCRAALRLWPDYPEAHCNLGLALHAKQKHDEAIAAFRRALALKPDLAAAHNNLGIVLREQNQTDAALDHFRRAVELAPHFAPALTNLGQMLLDRQQAEEALPHCQEAVRIEPNLAALHHNLGNTLRQLGRHSEAKAAYLEALRLAPDQAITHAHLGQVLQSEGEPHSALAWLRQAVELEPDNARFWESLAELQAEQEDVAAALTSRRQVVLIEPERADAHLALSWALQEEGQLDAAERECQQALVIDPQAAAGHLNLGGLCEECGDLVEAERRFRQAISLTPSFALPYARLATLLRGTLPDADLAALEALLANPDLGPGPRARVLFGLAQVLDARGEFARAALCLREANAKSLELVQIRRKYAPVEHERFIDHLIAQFDRPLFERLAGCGTDARRPVFVFGLPRSGTTLVEQVLASHPQVIGAGELRLVRQTFEALPGRLGRSEPPMSCVQYLDSAAVGCLAAEHLDRLAGIAGSKASRVIDKMPDNYLYLGLLRLLFPQATFIHCRRDLRDVAVSCWSTDFRSIRWANDVEHLAGRFLQYQRLMEHWHRVLPGMIHEIQYERMVDDLETQARGLIAACGLEWEPACLEFHRTKRPVRTASVMQVRQPIYRRSVARWKNYQTELAELFAQLALAAEPGAER